MVRDALLSGLANNDAPRPALGNNRPAVTQMLPVERFSLQHGSTLDANMVSWSSTQYQRRSNELCCSPPCFSGSTSDARDTAT